MIDYISGHIAELTPTRVVIDNHGIGYAMEISLQTYAALEGKSDALVYIYHHIQSSSDTELYYGFSDRDERAFFELLISVSGVGVNSARMILSSLSADEIRSAILSENVNVIKSVKGIGLKTAQRMVLELKDKISKGEGATTETLFVAEKNATMDEAASALTMLGFSKPNINKVLQNIAKTHPTAKVEEIIKMALKML